MVMLENGLFKQGLLQIASLASGRLLTGCRVFAPINV